MITAYRFGSITIDGVTFHRDVLIHQGQVTADWRRDAGHRCTAADLALILADPPEILVLGRGKPGLMRSSTELRAALDRLGVLLIEEPTARAVATFNRLIGEGRPVSAGLHLTC